MLMEIKPILTRVVLSLACLGLFSCTPKSTISQTTITFPDWSQLQSASAARLSKNQTLAAGDLNSQISIITINVSGAGVDRPVPFSWKRNLDSDVPPVSATFSVPAGALVQVLAVLEGSGAAQFYYGDASVSPTAEGDVALGIDLTNVAAAQDLTEGSIVGRYMTAPDFGPTGTFQYRFQPPNRPAMIVTYGEVFSGWMNTFALSSSLLQYTWLDGSPAFGFNSLDNSLLSPTAVNPSRSARIYIPAGFQNQKYDGTFYMQPRAARFITAGFFGPYLNDPAVDTATGRKLCLPTSGGALPVPQLYATANLLDPTAAPSDPMTWVGISTVTNSLTQIRIPNPLAAGYGQGGDISGSCSSIGLPYTNFLTLDQTQLKSSDSFLGFRGPFKILASGNYLDAVFNSANSRIDVSFDGLPGVRSSLGGVSIFWRVAPAGQTGITDRDVRIQDGYRCNDLRKAALFAVPFNEIPVVVVTGTTTVQIPSIPDAATAAQVQVLACPSRADGTFFISGVMAQNGVSTFGPRVLVGLPGQTWDMSAKQYRGIPLGQHQNIPFAVELRALTPTGALDTSFSQVATSTGVDLRGTGVTINTPSPTWTAGVATVLVAINSNSAGQTFLTGGGTTGLDNATTSPFPLLPQPSVLNVATLLPTTIVTSVCQPALVGAGTSSPIGSLLNVTTATNLSFSPVNASVFTDADCTVPDSTPALTPIQSSGLHYYQPTNTGSYSLTLSGSGLTGTNFGSVASSSAPGDPMTIHLLGFDVSAGAVRLDVGVCQPFMLMTADASGNSVVPRNKVTASVTMTGHGFLHMAADCSDAPQSVMNLTLDPADAATKRATVFYVQRVDANNDVISATDVTIGSQACGSTMAPASCGSSETLTLTP
jgi:hypothetical protein